MACAVKVTDLTKEQAETIHRLLYLMPNTIENKYNKNSEKTPIQFYQINEGVVELPYLFASSLLKIIPNVNKPFPVTTLEFTSTLRDYQVAVEEEAALQLNKHGTTTLALFPGFGKTILGAKLASRAKLMTVVLVHREILCSQWKKTFIEHTNAQVWIVGEPTPPSSCDVIICMNTRWHKIPKYMRDAIGFLIIDEAHCFCTPTNVPCLLAFHPKYILIETATLERDDDGMEVMIYAIAGTHGVFRESTKPFSIVKVKTNCTPEVKKNRLGDTSYASILQSLMNDNRRNEIIMSLVNENLNKKILILTHLVEHAEILNKMLQNRSIPCDYLCGNKKSYVDSCILIGTTSKIGTGFDPASNPTYDGRPFDVLILCNTTKKTSVLVQTVGRVFRAQSPTVYYLADNNSSLKKHWYICRKWFLKRGGLLTNMEFKNNERPTSTIKKPQLTQQSWAASKIKQLSAE